MDEDAVFEFEIAEIGYARLSTFCPICRAQLFGSLYDQVAQDIAEHLNTMHPMRGVAQ